MKKESAITTYVVSRLDAKGTLQAFLAAKLGVSKRAAKTLMDDRKVWVNRQCVWMAHHALRQGDTVEIAAALKHERKRTPPKIRVLAEDDFYLVVDKPSDLLSVGEDSAEALLRAQTGLQDIQAVHRLDRDTTGCLLFAKTGAAHEAAVAVFRTRRVTKLYQVVVWGAYGRKASTVAQELDGDRAVSHIQREAYSKDASFLKVRIETGRTHQIRRHLASIRHPVLGDREHGVKSARDPRLLTIPRQMLHACGIEMPHPMVPGETLKAHSPLPADFRRCLSLFEMGKSHKD
ncbi:MAG: RluA family pseudouridine synthase [Kiritimatiellaeota bacterium]|nr:RluA family pseudouridine synthase [Kiritimatiellota bacterium]